MAGDQGRHRIPWVKMGEMQAESDTPDGKVPVGDAMCASAVNALRPQHTLMAVEGLLEASKTRAGSPE